MLKPRRRQAGFSLVELIITIAIIAIALFGALSMIIHTSNETQAMKELELAREAAGRKIEELRALPWSNPSNPQGWLEQYLQPNLLSIPTGGFTNVGTFTVDTLASKTTTNKLGRGSLLLWGIDRHADPVSGATIIDVADMEVLIEWTGIKGPSRFSLRTMYSRVR